MSQVWATKYRSRVFSDLLGQDNPKRIVYGALDEPDFPSTLLVTGPFGSGKTSIVRIIGRMLICKNPLPNKDPCGQCWSCQLDISKGESPNYREEDAASCGHVDEVEEMLQDAKLAPMDAPRRVLVLDEAHMLTKPAQNKLLKSLEEGVGKTCIMLVTTDPEKLLDTIRSRCIALNITAVDRRTVLEFLKEIVKKEGKKAEESALELIVDQTYGHIRNTLNLAYQISLSGDITLKAVRWQLNLHMDDRAAELLMHVGESWDVAVSQAEALAQESAPEDIWTSVRKCIGQSFLSVNQPARGASEFIKKVAERYGIRLGPIAEWALGDGARLYVKTSVDLLVALAVVRDKLGVSIVDRDGGSKKIGVPKARQPVVGGHKQPALTEEKLVDLLELKLLDKTNLREPTNGVPPGDHGV
jgi:DNA polymerase III subunit gamma/tau